MTPRLLTTQEAAERLGLTPGSLQELRWKDDGLPIFQNGLSVHYRLEDLEAFEQRELRTLLKQVLQRERPLPLIRAIARSLDLSVNTQGIESNPEVFKPAARQDLKPAPKVKGAAPMPTEELAQALPAKATAAIDLSLQPNHAWYLVHTKGRQEDIRKLRGALSIDASAPVTPVVEGVWDIGTHKRRPVVLGRKIDGVMWQALKIFHGHEPRRNSWVITPRPFGPALMEPLAGTATWWYLEDRFSIHGLALRYLPLDAEQGGRVQEPGAAYAVHGPFTTDFGMAVLDDWPHGPIRLSGAQSRLFAVLWKHRHQAQTAELLMREAGLASDRPLDLFKIKAANRGDPAYEGPLHAYERLVVRQRRLGLYQLAWTD